MSVVFWYNSTITFLAEQGLWFVLVFLVLFFGIKVVFFVFASIKFVIQLLRHHLL